LERKVSALEEKLARKNEVLSELMEEHVALKKVLGRVKTEVGAARSARPGGRFRAPLVGKDRNPGCASGRLGRPCAQQVLRLEKPLRQGQRAQRLDSARSLAGGLGGKSHY